MLPEESRHIWLFWQLPLTVIISLVCALMTPAEGRSESSVTLKFKYRAGDTYTYQANGQIGIAIPQLNTTSHGAPQSAASQGGPIKIPISATQKLRIIQVDSAGNARLEILSTGKPVSLMPRPEDKATETKLTVTETPQGIITEASSVGNIAPASALDALGGAGIVGSISVYLPSKRVVPGATWKMDVKTPSMPDTATVSGVYVEQRRVGRYKTARLKLTVIVPIRSSVAGAGGLAGKFTMHYDIDFAINEGILIKSMGTGTAALSFRQAGASQPNATAKSTPLTATVTMTRTLVI